MVSRNFVYPGSWVYVWSRQGGLDPNQWYVAQTETSAPFPLPPLSLGLRSLEPWDEHFHHALRIPGDVPPGKYQLYQSGVTTGIDMTVDNAPDMSTGTVIDPSVSDPATAIESALTIGNVTLKAGAYVLSRRILLPTGRTIRGDGAVLIRNWDVPPEGGPTDTITRIFEFRGQDGRMLLEGLTFVADRRPAGTALDQGLVALADRVSSSGVTPSQTNVTLRRCVFRNVNLGEWPKPGFLAEDCLWEEGAGCLYAVGPGIAGPALFLRCTVRGLPDGGHSWITKTGSGVGLLDCDFIDTDRGPFFQANEGPIENNLVSGLVCDNIVHTENGCEGIGIEGVNFPVRDNLFLHIRYQGDAGIVLYAVNASGNLFRDFVLDGGFGVELAGGLAQTDNTFLDGEVRGGRCILDDSATRNIMRNVAFVGPRPTRGNLYTHVADPAPSPVISNFSNNPSIDYIPVNAGTVKIARLLDGWTVHD
jgi:hypothetical protein